MGKFCPNCGMGCNSNEKYCMNCGERIDGKIDRMMPPILDDPPKIAPPGSPMNYDLPEDEQVFHLHSTGHLDAMRKKKKKEAIYL